MKKIYAIVILSCLMTACAATPESVQPMYVSQLTYSPYSCGQLSQEKIALNNSLASVSESERKARLNDAASLALVGAPISVISGKHYVSEIAQIRGSLAALQLAQTSKQCVTS